MLSDGREGVRGSKPHGNEWMGPFNHFMVTHSSAHSSAHSHACIPVEGLSMQLQPLPRLRTDDDIHRVLAANHPEPIAKLGNPDQL